MRPGIPEKTSPVVAWIVVSASLWVLVGPVLTNDFVEYWAAGSLNLAGDNPYDPGAMLEVEQAVGYAGDRVVMMFNPPLVLTVVMPFGALPYRIAARLWLALLGAALIWSCTILWDLSGGDTRRRWLVYACCIWFVPTLLSLILGQISILSLLGLALFMRFLRDGRMLAAGMTTVLLAIKPHLLYLVGFAIIVWWSRSRDKRFLSGVVLAGAVSCLVPVVFNPHVYAEYLQLDRWELLRDYSSSTLGAALRLVSGEIDRFRLQFIPMIPGVAYLAARLWSKRLEAWDWEREMPMLVAVSVATAAYGWVFDQVLLLVTAIPMIVVSIRERGWRLAVVVGFGTATTIATFYLASQDVNYFWYFWLPVVFVVAGFVVLESEVERVSGG